MSTYVHTPDITINSNNHITFIAQSIMFQYFGIYCTDHSNKKEPVII